MTIELFNARLERQTALTRHQMALHEVKRVVRCGPARRIAAQKEADQAWERVITACLKCSAIAYA